MIIADIDYTIPTVAMLMVVYALVDKIIVPLLRKHSNASRESTDGAVGITRHELQRRIAAIEACIQEDQRLLSALRTEVSVAAAILQRIEGKWDIQQRG